MSDVRNWWKYGFMEYYIHRHENFECEKINNLITFGIRWITNEDVFGDSWIKFGYVVFYCVGKTQTTKCPKIGVNRLFME